MVNLNIISELQLKAVKIEGLLAVLSQRPDDLQALLALYDEVEDFNRLHDSLAPQDTEESIDNDSEVTDDPTAESIDEAEQIEIIDNEIDEDALDIIADDDMEPIADESPNEVNDEETSESDVDLDDKIEPEVEEEIKEGIEKELEENQAFNPNFLVADARQSVPDQADQIRLDEMFLRKNAGDLRNAFTLNDKFRFRRSLFNNSDDEFTLAINLINGMNSLEEAEDYMFNKLNLDPEDNDVNEFMSIITNHFCV